jgi:ribosomal protein S18 acetylase RimI-like enzyme
MLIRKATVIDLPDLSELASHVYYKTFGPDGYFPTELSMSHDQVSEQIKQDKSEEAFAHAMNVDGDIFLVAEYDNQFTGYVGIRNPNIEVIDGRQPTDKDQATNGIYVHPDFHRQGIGNRLLQAALEEPRLKQAENIYATVWEENKPSFNLFTNNGFKIAGKKKVMSGDEIIGYDAVLMKSNT